MRIVVFGANGGAGRLLTRRLLDHGHDVAAVTRRPRQFPFHDPNLEVVDADVRDAATVRSVIDGADAVVSTLSTPFTNHPVDLFSTGMTNIVSAMGDTGVRRLVVTSSAGAHHYPNRRNNPWYMKAFEPIMANTFGKTVYEDTRRMETITRDSGLDWTIVRPSLLFDLPV